MNIAACLLAVVLATAARGADAPLTVDQRLKLVGGEPCKRLFTQGKWQADAEGVAACMNLGCVADPLAAADSVGVCAKPQAAVDCAGQFWQEGRGDCGQPPLPPKQPDRLRARRKLVTVNSMLLSDNAGRWYAKPQALVSGFYQVALTRSRAVRGADGIWKHVGIPKKMLHLGVYTQMSEPQLLGGELGLVTLTNRKLGPLKLTRAAGFGMGQVHAAGSLLDDRGLRLGLGGHAEVKHNLIIKLGYLWDVSDSQNAFMAALEYGKFLRDDLWISNK